MNVAPAFVLAVLLSATALAQDVSGRGEWLVYGTHYGIDAASPFNPGNRVVQQAEATLASELRVDLSWTNEEFGVDLKPRLLRVGSAGGHSDREWFNEAYAHWRVADDVSLVAGRQVLLWGPAQFWNPSNPFFLANGKDNGQRELAGKGFVRARWQAGETLSIAALAQVDNGPFDLGAERVDALSVDWVGDEASGALIVAAPPGAALQWRGWAQWTAADACLLYGEAAWARRTVLVAQRAASVTAAATAAASGWQVAAGDDAYALDLVVGAAYTGLNGWTLNAEYYRHGSGFSSDELADWARLARAADGRLATSALAARQLAAALDPGSSPLSRNALGLQLRNGSVETIGWVVRYARSLDDGSGQGVVQLFADASKRWQLWANVVVEHGPASAAGAYRRWLASSAMVGVTAFLW